MPIYKKDNKFSLKLKTIIVPSVPIPKARPLTLTEKFKRQAKIFFQWVAPPKKDSSLSGRIHELNHLVIELSKSIEQIREYFFIGGTYDVEKDPELSAFVEAVIDPLLRESTSLYGSLHSSSVAEQARAFKKLGGWIDRAKRCVQFFDKKRSKQELLDKVVKYLVGEALHRVDRDIDIIKDYPIHQIQALPITDGKRTELTKQVNQAAEKYIQSLEALKIPPSKITFEGLGHWKTQIDHSRQTYFELALHVIDTEITNAVPFDSEENREDVDEGLADILSLEQETKQLTSQLKQGFFLKERDLENLRIHLNALAEEAQKMLLDFRLDWQLIARLQVIAADIKLAQQLLNEKTSTR